MTLIQLSARKLDPSWRKLDPSYVKGDVTRGVVFRGVEFFLPLRVDILEKSLVCRY